MSLGFRRFLLSFFVLVFAITAPYLVLYAQGYRINFPLKSGGKFLVKTGGVFVKTLPKQAAVYVDGKLVDQTDFFFGSLLAENLLPRVYGVEVKKSGFFDWKKNLDVQEKQVTEARNITLIPDSLDFSCSEKNIDNAWLSPDKQKIVLLGQGEDGWNMRLYDIQKKITSQILDEKNLSAKGANLINFDWVKGNEINITIQMDNSTSTWAIATDKIPAKVTKFIASAPIANKPLTESESEGTKYYLNKDGFLTLQSLTSSQTTLNKDPLQIDEKASYDLWVFNDYYFVRKNRELWVLKQTGGNFEKIFNDLESELQMSPDGGKVVYNSNSEIWIFSLRDKTEQPVKKAGQLTFIARFSEKIKDCTWLNSDYLIFWGGDKIKVTETDDRDKVNMYDLASWITISGAAPDGNAKMIWDTDTKTLYTYNNKNLYSAKIEY